MIPESPPATARAARSSIAVLALFASAGLSTAHADPSCTAGFAKLRFEDDVTCFRDTAPADPLDRLKTLPLTADEDVWLSLGGEIRQRYEYVHNPAFGADPQDDRGVWLHRYTLHGDLTLGPHLRAFAQLFSAQEAGRAGGPSPVDENQLEFQNAFLDLRAPVSPGATSTLRLGRQELDFGSGRLVDVRDGPNVRRGFDAGRAFLAAGDWRVDALLARPRAVDSGAFDDEANDAQTLWGFYASGDTGIPAIGTLDLYYLGFRDEDAAFVQGAAEERRHSFGARLSGNRGPWDWNWEAVYQTGSFGEGDIDAWTLASVTGYRFSELRWQPRVALSANIASGDDDPDDADLGTFNPLFPRGNYFSEAAVLGPRNFYNLHGFLTVNPTEDLALTVDANAFWRLETEDGVYSPSGQAIVAGGGDDRFVGSAVSLTAEYALTRRIDLTAIYTRFFTGDVIDAAGPSEDIDFVELTARFRF